LLSGFQAGLLSAFLVPAHAMALLALGLTIGQQERRGVTLLAFAAGLIMGLLALASGVGETSANTVLLAATLITGMAAAIGWALPALIGAPIALVIGVGLGLDSPPKAVSIQAANTMLAGTALGACIIVTLVAAVVMRLSRAWARIGVRVLGSWIAASAILVLALRFGR
jgi:hypothetical protein